MQPWRLLDLAANNAFANMAIDEAMLNACIQRNDVPATVRFYTWSPPAVSIGCLQKISGNFDPAQAKGFGLDTVRRPTGGRSVLHKGDLTYSVVFAENNPLIPRGILASYQKINQAVQRGLWRLGIPSQLCPKRKVSRSSFCFSGVAQYEILVHGKKIMGNAQKRTKGACLQQGSIMAEDQQKLIRQLFPQPGDSSPYQEDLNRNGAEAGAGTGAGTEAGAESGAGAKAGTGTESGTATKAGVSEFISLEEVFGSPVAVSLIKEALIRGFEEIFHICFTFGSLTDWEEEEAARLIQEKYSRHIWNKEGHL